MQILLNGLISGFGIALLATAFQIVYLPTRVFFLGLAGIYSITPFFAKSLINAMLYKPVEIYSLIVIAFFLLLAPLHLTIYCLQKRSAKT